MEVWQPRASSKSGVLIFEELTGWTKIKSSLGTRNGDSWVPLKAKIGRGKPKHFAYMGTLTACNEEAWQILSEKIKDEVEGLPILVNETRYYIFNVLNVVDCLDVQKSKFFRTPFDAGCGEIIHFVFEEAKLDGHFLFTIPQKPKMVFATTAFKELVEANKLKEIDFEKPESPLVGLMKLTQ